MKNINVTFLLRYLEKYQMPSSIITIHLENGIALTLHYKTTDEGHLT